MKKKNNSLTAGGFAHSKIKLDDITATTFADSLPIIKRDFNGQLINCVSANALHNVLVVDTRLTDWIKRRINEYGFIQGINYLIVETLSGSKLSSAKSRQQIKHEYLVTFNMPKELGMVERTEQGRLIRQYYIKCEEALNSVAPTITKQLRQQLKSRFKVASYFKPICSALDLAKMSMLKICAPQNGGGLSVSNNELYGKLLLIVYQVNSSLQACRDPVKVDALTNTVTLTYGITGNQLAKNFTNLKRIDTTPFTPMGDKPRLLDIQSNKVTLFSNIDSDIRCSYLSIGLSINTLCGGILTAGGIPPLRNWLLSSTGNTVVKYNQGVMTSPIGDCAGNQGFIGNKKGSTANATLLDIDNFICRKFLDVNSNPDQQCCIVQIVGTHNLFSSCLTACVLSLYSALIASSSAERDSYLAAIPDEINRLTTVFISSAVLSSSGNMLLVFPVNSESMCLQNVFAGQLQETPIFPDTSNNSTLYISFLLLLNARNLNVIAMSLTVSLQKI
ncbi:antA/AntB antirepressor family protein, partial [Providencia rettgeri]